MDHQRGSSPKCAIILLAVTVVLLQGSLADSYKILTLYPTMSKSHTIISSAVMKGLAEAGHEVTVISSFPQKQKIPNYRDVYIELTPALKRAVDDSLANDREFTLTKVYNFAKEIFVYFNTTMGLPELQRMMREESFDLIITMPLGGKMLSGLATHFNCPLVYLMPTRIPSLVAGYIGNPMQISSVPALLSPLRNPMSFLQRVQNLLVSVAEYAFFWVTDLMEWHYYNTHFSSPKYPSYHTSRSNVSLVLTAHHFTQGPVANLPQVVEIGGVQMDLKLEPLPENIQTYLDGDDDVIFLSFGTNFKVKNLDPQKLWHILRALGKLNLKVLMKYDTDEKIAGLPENILTAAWLPQREILAHPNVKLFISHGGLGSVMESKYYGVPVLGIPLFADQPGNIRMAVNEGWALQLDVDTLTEEQVSTTLKELLNNSSYAATVKTMSSVYRDRPMRAMETAIFWIEYVIRHRGAPHMRSAASSLNLLQRCSLDVLAFLGVILYVLLRVSKYLFWVCRRKMTSKFRATKKQQ